MGSLESDRGTVHDVEVLLEHYPALTRSALWMTLQTELPAEQWSGQSCFLPGCELLNGG